MRGGQTLFEVVRQGFHGLDESSGLAVANDASQGGFVEGDGGGCALFASKGTSGARF